MSLRKSFLASVTNSISKLCYSLYRKVDRTSLDFCLLNKAGFKNKRTLSTTGEIECHNLNKITMVVSEIMDLDPYSFHYLKTDQELIISLNSTKITKSFLKSLSSMDNKTKLYSEERLFTFYLELVAILTEITQSKQYIKANLAHEILNKEAFSGLVKKEIKLGKTIIIHDQDLKKED